VPPYLTRCRPPSPGPASRLRRCPRRAWPKPAALAWAWALTGTKPSPVTLSLAPGRPPSRSEILAEADAEPEGSTAPAGVPSDYCDQFGEVRRILTWLTGASDEIPLDDEQRGRFVGARDDYARTGTDIREVSGYAVRSLAAFDLPGLMDPDDAADPWRWEPAWMNAAWQRGVRDLLSWVLGDRAASPLCGRTVGLPAACDLSFEEAAARDVIAQGRPGGPLADPRRYPPPQYGEAIQAAITWLRGETTTAPAGPHGESPYQAGPGGGA
jgi:hypothetical protein